MDNTEKECLLYLPLFSEIKSLRIGIKESANISAIDYPFKKKILIYGSSIVHGAEASRAGTTYVSKIICAAQVLISSTWDSAAMPYGEQYGRLFS